MSRVVVVVSSLVVLLLGSLVLGAAVWFDHFRVSFPEYEGVNEMYWLDQNWSEDERQWFYHTSQGTKLVPLAWLLHLEQPKVLGIGAVPKFLENDYIRGFGLLPNRHQHENPYGLPVGLAVDEEWRDLSGPDAEKKSVVVGLTCAACHTGQLEYNGIGVRVDGGPAQADIIKLSQELAISIMMTRYLPPRMNRFARNVLGEHYSTKARATLVGDLDRTIADLRKLGKIQKTHYPTEEGPGRLDALARIGNFVFGTDMDKNTNLVIGDAPVSFPPLWDTSWFDWVQYDASIRQPMMRNVSEALGVFAGLNLTEPDFDGDATVRVENLFHIEHLLAGDEPYTGLRSPMWPEEIFGPIDESKRDRGRELYREHCQHCHRPALDSDDFWSDDHWETRAYTQPADGAQPIDPGKDGEKAGEGAQTTYKRWFAVKTVPVEHIGTDINVLRNFGQRMVELDELLPGEKKGQTLQVGQALAEVSEQIIKKQYAALDLDVAQRAEHNGYRADNLQVICDYKARPLNGVWATAPYLHNGSVPSLYEMLVPAEQRSRTFYTGARDFDPQHVGFRKEKFPGGFLFDTREDGNANSGHEFKNAPRGNGVIGPELTEDERYSLIEYLKSLPNVPVGTPGPINPDGAPPEVPGQLTSRACPAPR